MPKIVDHEERRDELIEAAIRVITRVGLENATTRLIATESGYSNGVLAHYFDDKDGILESVLRYTHRRIGERQRAALRGKSGLAALRALLADNLPLDEARRQETLLEMSFWTRAVHSEALLAFHEDQAGLLLNRVETYIEECRTEGSLFTDLSNTDVAELLMAHIDGMSVHILLFPRRLPRKRVGALLDDLLAGVGFQS